MKPVLFVKNIFFFLIISQSKAESLLNNQNYVAEIIPISMNIKSDLPTTLRFCIRLNEDGGIICLQRENETTSRGFLDFTEVTPSSRLTSYISGKLNNVEQDYRNHALKLKKVPENVWIFVDQDKEDSPFLVSGYVNLSADCTNEEGSNTQVEKSTKLCTLYTSKADATFSIRYK